MKFGNLGAAATRVIRRRWCDVVWPVVLTCWPKASLERMGWDAESRSGQTGLSSPHHTSTTGCIAAWQSRLFEVVALPLVLVLVLVLALVF